MRVIASVLDPRELRVRLARRWGWRDARVEFWNRGVNDTYRVQVRAGGRTRKAYLRVYRHRWRTRRQIQGEVDLLLSLRQRRADVAYPIAKPDGTCIEELQAPEGRRYAVLYSAAQGVMPRLDAALCRRFGRLAGALHAHCDASGERFSRARFSRPPLDLENLVRAPLRTIAGFIESRRSDVGELKAVARQLSARVTSLLPARAPEFGLCHGDLYAGNLARSATGRLTLFDFDNCGYGWRAYDLADFLWTRGAGFTRAARLQRARDWNAFVEGYRSARALSAAELQAAHAFVPLRLIWLMGLHIRLRADRGANWVGPAYIDERLEFIRQWMRIYKPL
jgi:Ser/Thr protein kinase RdoA (MazF antagonist)